jgi:hypothetical protein
LLAFALSGSAFASEADFDLFFTMTPLRDAFAGFFAGADAIFGGAADTGSATGTAGGGDLTITFAATALSEERAHCEHCNGCAMYIARPTRESF